MVRG
ncbi:uncharacterized protein FTOL_13860 [Fusarium torulosum]|jgi:hypothetical protein